MRLIVRHEVELSGGGLIFDEPLDVRWEVFWLFLFHQQPTTHLHWQLWSYSDLEIKQ